MPDDREPRLTLAEHLEELRRRLGISLAAFLLGVGISGVYVERVVQWLRRPIAHRVPRFAFFTPTEPLLAYLKVALLCGAALAMPVVLWQLWLFVRGGLKPGERRYGAALIGWGSLQFLLGLAFAALVLLPLSLNVLLGIGHGMLEPVLSLDRYLSFVTTLAFWCGVVFELPVVLWVLARLGIVTPEWLRQQRPYAILILVILAAIATPTTDAVSLLLLAVPLVLLYELSVWLTRWSSRRR